MKYEPVPRPSSMAVSVGIHAAVVTVAILLPHLFGEPPIRSKVKYRSLRDYGEHVRLTLVMPLPAVKPSANPRRKAAPVARRSPLDAAFGRDPNSNQLVWLPEPKIEVRNNAPAPNLAVLEMKAPAAPPPPKREVRNFSAPPVRHETREQKPIDSAPQVAIAAPAPSGVPAAFAGRLSGPPARNFELTKGTAPAAQPVELAPPPPATGGGFEGGTGSVSLVIAGMTPNAVMPPEPPKGLQSAALGSGPGGDGEGGGPGQGIVVPGVSIAGDPAASAGGSRAAPATRSRAAAETPRTPAPAAATSATARTYLRGRSLVAPLRPAARVVPASVESRFRTRNVYTCVVQREGVEKMEGDWVLWFAERDPSASGPTFVRPPVAIHGPSLEGGVSGISRALLTAFLTSEGKLEQLAAHDPQEEAALRPLMKLVSAWEFLPVLRGNHAVAVEMMIDITLPRPGLRSSR